MQSQTGQTIHILQFSVQSYYKDDFKLWHQIKYYIQKRPFAII
jgi:hypothetical protein